jgi:Flp pilus assembly protein TadG
MQKALQKIFSFFIKTDPPRNKKVALKSRGQSLVEVAISFPILIMLFAGMIEFGFILNYYLSLLDATREAARRYSNGDPFNSDGVTANASFYMDTADYARDLLDPSVENIAYKGRRIAIDPATDDVIVSVYGAKNNTVTLLPGGPYHLFANGKYQSIFTVQSMLDSRDINAPNAGILVVEVHYNYHHVLGLPWMTAVLPNPLHLQAYTIMPIRAAEPK